MDRVLSTCEISRVLLLFGLPEGWLGLLPDCDIDRYSQTSWLQHIFSRPDFLVQNSLVNTSTTFDNATFKIFVLSY